MSTPFDAAFAARIVTIRKSRGLSQARMARLLPRPFSSQATLSKVETGQRKVSVGEAFILADALDIPVSALLGLSDDGAFNVTTEVVSLRALLARIADMASSP